MKNKTIKIFGIGAAVLFIIIAFSPAILAEEPQILTGARRKYTEKELKKIKEDKELQQFKEWYDYYYGWWDKTFKEGAFPDWPKEVEDYIYPYLC